jgi:Nitrile hydratase beta subunit
MRGPHDVGGMTAGPIDTEPHKLTFWEKQIDAIHTLLGDEKRRLISRDENRAAIEALGNDAYSRLTYYERWTAAISLQLVKKGVLTQDEIDAKVAEITQRLEETGELE